MAEKRERTEINPLGAGREKKEGKKLNFIFGTETLEIISSKKKGTRTKFVEESIKKNSESI